MPSTVLSAEDTKMDKVVTVPGQLELKRLVGKTALNVSFQSEVVDQLTTRPGGMRSRRGDHCTGYPTGLLIKLIE